MTPLYTVQPNHCDCHPETCCCDAWAIYKQDNKYLTIYDEEKAEEVAALLNSTSSAPVEQAAPVTVPNGWKPKAIQGPSKSVFYGGNTNEHLNREVVLISAEDYKKCCELLAAAPAAPSADAQDAKRLDWLEEQARKSYTGISFDYVRHVEEGYVTENGYRFMRRHFLGERKPSIRAAIDAALSAQKEGE